LGDETGVVKGFFYQNEALKEGNTIVIFRAEATVVKEHIEVQLMERGRVDVARRDIKDVNKSYDVSAKEWIEQS
jgi:ssDNA-binding replication factor A large subunit